LSSLILIVDDDHVTRESLKAILHNSEYQIESAESGVEAVQKARLLLPDLILLDVMMPEMDGFEVCHAIRMIPTIAEVPILIMTALDDQESFIHGLEMGADDFLSKPVNSYELRARVKTIIRLNRYRQLVNERARIRELTTQIIDLQEEERRRIAQELHDDVGQSLTTLSIGLKLLSVEECCQPVTERVNDLRDLTLTVMTQLRQLSHELRPPALDMLGLELALSGFCQDFSRRTQIPVLFRQEGQLADLPDAENITFYRFLQEVLTNIVKHANASQVWVKLIGEADGTRITVRDDGDGFSRPTSTLMTATFQRKDGTTGMGLLGMQERITHLGGTLEIESQAGQGAHISAWVPHHMKGIS
jgi:signal transduction histidine kinase